MMDENKLKLAKFIAKKSMASHEYGVNDCMTFPIEWHDHCRGTRQLDKIYRRYHSLATAFKFYRNFLSVTGWLRANGYHEVDDISDGDFVVQTVDRLPQVWIYFNGALYTIHEQRGLTAVNIELVENYTVWSR